MHGTAAGNLSTGGQPDTAGEKQLSIGNEVLSYRAGHTFASALDLPALGIITEASTEHPYLAIRLDVDTEIISDLVFSMPDLARTVDQKGFGVYPAERDLLDAWSRMLGLIKRSDDVPVMAPMLEREIVYRLLRGPQGAVLRQLAATDTRMSQIRKRSEERRVGKECPV